MASPTNGTYPDSVFQRLLDTARRLAPMSRDDRELISKIAHHREQVEAAKYVGAAPTTPTSDDPPDEFTEVLRQQKGEQQYLSVVIDGGIVELVLNPRGEANLPRERYLWRWLLRRTRQGVS